MFDVLPFARGTTWADGQVTPGTDVMPIAGKVYCVKDTVHGSGSTIKLRCVKNESTAITVARTVYKFHTTTEDFGATINGLVSAQGGAGKPLDDAYTVGQVIPANDYLYLVEEGWCYVNTHSTGSYAIAAHEAVTTDANGCIDNNVATLYDHVLGIADAAITANATAYKVWVQGGLAIFA